MKFKPILLVQIYLKNFWGFNFVLAAFILSSVDGLKLNATTLSRYQRKLLPTWDQDEMQVSIQIMLSGAEVQWATFPL